MRRLRKMVRGEKRGSEDGNGSIAETEAVRQRGVGSGGDCGEYGRE
jgi:hypothetical protein